MNRIRFLCMLAYPLTEHLRQVFWPMPFDDLEPADDPALMGPRPRSVAAQ